MVFQAVQCLLNFHYDVGRQGQGIEIYPCIKFCLTVFSFVSYMYMHIHTCTCTCMPLRMYMYMYCLRLFLWFSNKHSV